MLVSETSPCLSFLLVMTLVTWPWGWEEKERWGVETWLVLENRRPRHICTHLRQPPEQGHLAERQVQTGLLSFSESAHGEPDVRPVLWPWPFPTRGVHDHEGTVTHVMPSTRPGDHQTLTLICLGCLYKPVLPWQMGPVSWAWSHSSNTLLPCANEIPTGP